MKTKQLLITKLSGLLLATALFACTQKAPEPEKIVYGPIKQVYELPVVKGTIYYVAPDGNAEAAGTSVNEPTIIEAAIAKVVTGDALVMRGGIYRTGNLTFNQGITIQPYKDEQPIIKGTYVATDWQNAGDNLWVTNWEFLFPAGPEDWWRREREEKYTPMHRFNNDGIFVDGQFLQSAGSKEEVNEVTYFVDYDAQQIYIGTEPAGKLIEITAYRKAIFRTTGEAHGKLSDGRGPTIRGIEFTQYPDTMVHIDGYYPQGMSAEHEHGKDVIGTVFENCTFSNCFRIGLFAIGDSMVMRNCEVRNTNTEGVYIVASSDVLLERNIFANNNIEKWTGFYPSAVKIFNQTHRVVCRENLVIDHPFSNGIWYDVGNENGIFVNNHLENVSGAGLDSTEENRRWRDNSAFFFEISKGTICAGNVFVNCDKMWILNSSDAVIYNNTFINTRVSFSRDTRGDNNDHFGWHIFTGPGVEERENHVFVNNLMVMKENYATHIFQTTQPPHMCERLNQSQLKELDYNYYVRLTPADTIDAPIVLWSPAPGNENCFARINAPDEITAMYPNFSVNSRYLKNYDAAIFVDEANNDFRLMESFAKETTATKIPEKIRKAMGLKDGDADFIGAKPVK